MLLDHVGSSPCSQPPTLRIHWGPHATHPTAPIVLVRNQFLRYGRTPGTHIVMLVTTVVAYASNISSGLLRFHDDIVLRYWRTPGIPIVTHERFGVTEEANIAFEMRAHSRNMYRDIAQAVTYQMYRRYPRCSSSPPLMPTSPLARHTCSGPIG